MLTAKPKVLTPNYKLVTAPAVEPVTISEFHAHTETSGLGKDDKIEDFLITARMSAEKHCGRSFITTTHAISFDVGAGIGVFDPFWYHELGSAPLWIMPRMIELPYPKLIGVSSIKYFLDDGVEAETTFSSTYYSVSTYGMYGRVMLKSSAVWPSGLRPMDSIIITYTSGYGATAADVPQDIKEAILIWAAHDYENREGQRASNEGGAIASSVKESFVPAGVRTKLQPYVTVKL